ncbi:hypothetical protein [Chitinilyticum aquatile]|uniref:hypothetical protein n=1 Tax=Chitinilyticum aquatile TaxID=362520 RepID=UPI00041E4075|nr:hypothetical protein [Chitinilyticum aquatile]
MKWFSAASPRMLILLLLAALMLVLALREQREAVERDARLAAGELAEVRMWLAAPPAPATLPVGELPGNLSGATLTEVNGRWRLQASSAAASTVSAVLARTRPARVTLTRSGPGLVDVDMELLR